VFLASVFVEIIDHAIRSLAGDYSRIPPGGAAWFVMIVCIVVEIILLEGVLWALWQFAVSRRSFLAARGWRPPLFFPMRSFRRRLGLPSFLANFGRGGLRLAFYYFVVAVFNTGLFALFAILFLVDSLPEFAERLLVDDSPNHITALFLGIAFLLNILGAGAFVARIANRRATKVYQDVREWDARAPIVFLRAFDQDKSRLKADSLDPFLKLAAGVGAKRTMDEILLEHASPYGPVIAIGDPRDPAPPLGAARVFVPGTDFSWRNVVSSLVGASKAVVMCPSQTEGVRWEMELIARMGAGRRTIYLANPALDREQTLAVFAALAPDGEIEVERGQLPIVAFHDPSRGWCVLSARRLNVQTVTVGLNIALQAMFGLKGEPLRKPKGAAAQTVEAPALESTA
jgi:hypothetical protein